MMVIMAEGIMKDIVRGIVKDIVRGIVKGIVEARYDVSVTTYSRRRRDVVLTDSERI